MADKPVVTAPTPVAAPTPVKPIAPTPVKKPVQVTPTPATPAISNAADATVTVGTTTAVFTVPAGGASGLYVLYGTDAGNLNHSSDIQNLTGSSATITVAQLDAKTSYTYQIVRTLGTQTVNSPNTTFTTKGYTVSLLFTDKDSKPVKGIKTELGATKQTSDKDGKVSFSNLSAGAYSPIFSYSGQSYSQDFNTTAVPTETATDGVVLSQTINVDNLATQHKLLPLQSSIKNHQF